MQSGNSVQEELTVSGLKSIEVVLEKMEVLFDTAPQRAETPPPSVVVVVVVAMADGFEHVLHCCVRCLCATRCAPLPPL